MSTATRAPYEPSFFLASSHAMSLSALDTAAMTTDSCLALPHARHATAFSSNSDSPSSAISPLALPRGSLASTYFSRAIPGNTSLAVPRQVSTPSSLHLAAPSSPTPAAASPSAATAASMAPQRAARAFASSGARNGRVFSPLSPAAHDPPRAQPSQFFSPRLAPVLDRESQRRQTQTQHQQRSASLSPTRVRGARANMTWWLPPASSAMPASFDGFASAAGAGAGGTCMDAAMPLSTTTLSAPSNPRRLPSQSPDGPPRASQQRSLSAENAPASSSHLHTIRRLVQQNGRMREAWEAERKYLEANRERAEEVYKEERELMEEERVEWEAEKACLLEQIGRLQHQVFGLGQIPELSEPGDAASKRVAFALGSGEDAAAASASASASRGSQDDQRHADASVARCAGDAASHPPTTAATPFQQYAPGPFPNPRHPTDLNHQQQHSQHHPPATASAQISPVSQSSHSPAASTAATAIATDASTADAMAPADDSDAEPAGPIVDVQEIHPDLEGIPIRATTFQKPTFTDEQASTTSESNAASPASSSPQAKAPPNRPASPKRSNSNEQTLNALAANAIERLTMYAGHTPSHSLSLPTTVRSTQTHTVSSSGSSTPTAPAEDDSQVPPAPAPTLDNPPSAAVPQQADENCEDDEVTPEQRQHAAEEAYLDLLLEEAGDRPLKGPLMVRNMPAHDEIFFRRLTDRLAEVSKLPEEALPTVLKDSPDVDESVVGDAAEALAGEEAAEGADGKVQSESDGGSGKEEEGEAEIPLKFRKNNNNFGAPFGTFR